VDEHTALQVKDELVDAGGDAVRAGVNPSDLPDRLYHFTDCQGLVGILTSRCLWASLATALNDESEVRYGLGRAERFLRAGSAGGINPDFLSEVADYLEPRKTLTGVSIEAEAYVISFCARMDSSVHWLHYGKSGTGCAIGFDTGGLIRPPFDLAPVIYDENEQYQLINSIVEKVWSVVRRYELDEKSSNVEKMLYDIAAHSVAAHIRAVGPRLKNPAFQNEDEWRLITHDLRIDGIEPKDGIRMENKFRASGGRIVPYMEYSLDGVRITDLVLGASFPMPPEDPAFAILFRKAAKGNPAVVRSVVPIRP
jgi:hypothetical protein